MKFLKNNSGDLKKITRSKSRCNNKKGTFNCITVNFDEMKHSIYKKQNFIISTINNYNNY